MKDPNLFIYDDSDGDGPKISVTRGDLQFIGLAAVVPVNPAGPTTVDDGDKIWIEFGGLV